MWSWTSWTFGHTVHFVHPANKPKQDAVQHSEQLLSTGCCCVNTRHSASHDRSSVRPKPHEFTEGSPFSARYALMASSIHSAVPSTRSTIFKKVLHGCPASETYANSPLQLTCGRFLRANAMDNNILLNGNGTICSVPLNGNSCFFLRVPYVYVYIQCMGICKVLKDSKEITNRKSCLPIVQLCLYLSKTLKTR